MNQNNILDEFIYNDKHLYINLEWLMFYLFAVIFWITASVTIFTLFKKVNIKKSKIKLVSKRMFTIATTTLCFVSFMMICSLLMFYGEIMKINVKVSFWVWFSLILMSYLLIAGLFTFIVVFQKRFVVAFDQYAIKLFGLKILFKKISLIIHDSHTGYYYINYVHNEKPLFIKYKETSKQGQFFKKEITDDLKFGFSICEDSQLEFYNKELARYKVV